jgi:hypothetical protein
MPFTNLDDLTGEVTMRSGRQWFWNRYLSTPASTAALGSLMPTSAIAAPGIQPRRLTVATALSVHRDIRSRSRGLAK